MAVDTKTEMLMLFLHLNMTLSVFLYISLKTYRLDKGKIDLDKLLVWKILPVTL